MPRLPEYGLPDPPRPVIGSDSASEEAIANSYRRVASVAEEVGFGILKEQEQRRSIQATESFQQSLDQYQQEILHAQSVDEIDQIVSKGAPLLETQIVGHPGGIEAQSALSNQLRVSTSRMEAHRMQVGRAESSTVADAAAARFGDAIFNAANTEEVMAAEEVFDSTIADLPFYSDPEKLEFRNKQNQAVWLKRAEARKAMDPIAFSAELEDPLGLWANESAQYIPEAVMGAMRVEAKDLADTRRRQEVREAHTQKAAAIRYLATLGGISDRELISQAQETGFTPAEIENLVYQNMLARKKAGEGIKGIEDLSKVFLGITDATSLETPQARKALDAIFELSINKTTRDQDPTLAALGLTEFDWEAADPDGVGAFMDTWASAFQHSNAAITPTLKAKIRAGLNSSDPELGAKAAFAVRSLRESYGDNVPALELGLDNERYLSFFDASMNNGDDPLTAARQARTSVDEKRVDPVELEQMKESLRREDESIRVEEGLISSYGIPFQLANRRPSTDLFELGTSILPGGMGVGEAIEKFVIESAGGIQRSYTDIFGSRGGLGYEGDLATADLQHPLSYRNPEFGFTEIFLADPDARHAWQSTRDRLSAMANADVTNLKLERPLVDEAIDLYALFVAEGATPEDALQRAIGRQKETSGVTWLEGMTPKVVKYPLNKTIPGIEEAGISPFSRDLAILWGAWREVVTSLPPEQARGIGLGDVFVLHDPSAWSGDLRGAVIKYNQRIPGTSHYRQRTLQRKDRGGSTLWTPTYRDSIPSGIQKKKDLDAELDRLAAELDTKSEAGALYQRFLAQTPSQRTKDAFTLRGPGAVSFVAPPQVTPKKEEEAADLVGILSKSPSIMASMDPERRKILEGMSNPEFAYLLKQALGFHVPSNASPQRRDFGPQGATYEDLMKLIEQGNLEAVDQALKAQGIPFTLQQMIEAAVMARKPAIRMKNARVR